MDFGPHGDMRVFTWGGDFLHRGAWAEEIIKSVDKDLELDLDFDQGYTVS